MDEYALRRIVEIQALVASAHAPALRDELLDLLKSTRDFLGGMLPTSALSDGDVAFIASLALETDRGCVLVGAARLDELLLELLRVRMIEGSDSATALLKPGKPLGEFMTRATVAYAFGLIGKAELQELQKIAPIRNKCAHVVSASGFDWADVANEAVKLRFCDPMASARQRFIGTVSYLGGRLRDRISKTGHLDQFDDGDVNALFPKN